MDGWSRARTRSPPSGRSPRLLASHADAQAPDLYVNSCYDEDTQEIAAFEELVGAHGGWGDGRSRACCWHPSSLLPHASTSSAPSSSTEPSSACWRVVGQRHGLLGRDDDMTSTRSGWLRPAATLVGVLVVFFTFPGRTAWSDAAFVLSVLAMVTGTVVLAWAITGHVRRQLRGDSDDLQSLVMLLALVLVVFAFGFYALERSNPVRSWG